MTFKVYSLLIPLLLGLVDSTSVKISGCQELEIYDITAHETSIRFSKPCDGWIVDHYRILFYDSAGNDQFSELAFCTDDICSAQISLLRPCFEYDVRVTAYQTSDESGTSANYTAALFSTLEAIPDEVTDLITTNANFTTIELSWHHPSVPHNRDCVFYYEVCYQLSSSKAVPICLTTEPITEFVNPFNYALEYLEPCSSYYVTITPITPSLRKGRLAPLVTRTLDDVPGAPQTLTVTNGQNGCVSLDWEPPATNANCVTGYSIGCRRLTNFNELMNGQVLQSDETSGTECGLLSCTTYDCYVVALGLTSLSESTFENITTTMSTPPGPPQSFAVSSPTTTSALLSWTRPDVSFNCVTGYRLQWRANSGNTTSIDLDDDEISYNVEGLLACTNYTFTIGALTDTINGDADSVRGRTLDLPPGMPTNLMVDPNGIGCDVLRVTWEEPVINPQCAVRQESDIISQSEIVNVHVADLIEPLDNQTLFSRTFSGLSPNTDYLIKVKFIALDGQEGEEASIAARTLPDISC